MDYSDIQTWKNLSSWDVCWRLSLEDEKNYDVGAMIVASEIFKRFKNQKDRVQFFYKCEKLKLHGEIYLNN